MSSAIDSTKPVAGSPTTLSVRQNFAAAKSEIEALQAGSATYAALAASSGSSLVGFIQSGVGAVARTQEGKDRDIKSFLDYGGVGDGSTNETSAFDIAAVGDRALLLTPEHTFLLRNSSLDEDDITLYGGGKIKNDTINQAIINVTDVATPSHKIRNFKAIDLVAGPMPTGSTDDFAAISIYGAINAAVINSSFVNVNTGVRFGYNATGTVRSTDGLALGVYVEDHEAFGIENIEGQYTRIIGLATHNNGVQQGLHSVRLAGDAIGCVLTSSVLRDSGTKAVSFQDGSENCIVSAVLAENVVEAGFQTDASGEIGGHHVISPVIVRNSDGQGVDLTEMSHCLVSMIGDVIGTMGVRVAGEGKHLVDAIIHTSATGAIVSSNFNILRVVIDGTSGTPVNITGSNNRIEVVATNGATNVLLVSGSNNVLTITESANGAVGLRIDGHGNHASGAIAGTMLVGGNNNVVSLSAIGASMTISGNRNTIYGVLPATITDTGYGNTYPGRALSRLQTVSLVDDFLGDVLADQWNGRVGSDPQCVTPTILADQQRGIVRLVTGDDAAASMAVNGVQLESGLNWRASQGGLVAEARFVVNSSSNQCVFFGFTDQNGALAMPFTVGASDVVTAAATDAVGFVYDTAADTDVFWLVGVKAGVQPTPQSAGVAITTGSTFQTLRVEVNSAGGATFYINGVVVGTAMTNAVTTSVNLTPVLAAFSRTTAVRNYDLDFMLVEANR